MGRPGASLGLPWPRRLPRRASAGGPRQYGSDFAGFGGAVPQIAATGPFWAGATAIWHVRGGRGGALTFVTIGLVELLTPAIPGRGLTSYNQLWFRLIPKVLSGPANTAGTEDTAVSFVVPAVLAGVDFYLQAWVVDASGPLGLCHSGGLELRFR